MRRPAIIALAVLSAVLSGCQEAIEPKWRVGTSKDIAISKRPGTQTHKGTPSILGLGWKASPAQNRAALKQAGLTHRITNRVEGGETTEVHTGKVYGREARVITTTQEGQLRRVTVHWPVDTDIHGDYQAVKRALEAQYGKAASLFTPVPPTDVMYRAASSRKRPPLTGWVFESGDAMGLQVNRPYLEAGDSTVKLELSLDSRQWRIDVGTFTPRSE